MAVSGGVEIRGLGKAMGTIAGVAARSADIRRVGGAVKAVYLSSNERHWANPGWQALSQETIERKQRQGIDVRPERGKSGALYRSLTKDHARGVKDVRTPDSLRFGSKIWYAAFQQGTVFQPARDLIELSWIERQMISRILSRYIAHGEALTL